jgi:hypothetical protein
MIWRFFNTEDGKKRRFALGGELTVGEVDTKNMLEDIIPA